MGESERNTYASWNNIVMHDLQAIFMPFSLSESDVEVEDNVKKEDFDDYLHLKSHANLGYPIFVL